MVTRSCQGSWLIHQIVSSAGGQKKPPRVVNNNALGALQLSTAPLNAKALIGSDSTAMSALKLGGIMQVCNSRS